MSDTSHVLSSEPSNFEFAASPTLPILAPTAIPHALRRQIETAVAAALTAGDTQERLRAVGVDMAADGSEALDSQIEQEAKIWRAVVAKAGIKVD